MLPNGGNFLKFAEQHGDLVAWVLVPENHKGSSSVTLVIATTGESIHNPNELLYLDTVLMRGGHFVVHIFQQL